MSEPHIVDVIAAALPADLPEHAAHAVTVNVAWVTDDPAALDRLAARYPGRRIGRSANYIAWADYEVGVSVQVSYIGEVKR